MRTARARTATRALALVLAGLVGALTVPGAAREGAPQTRPAVIVATGAKGARVRLVGVEALASVGAAWGGLVDPARLLAEGVEVDEDGRVELPLPPGDDPWLIVAGGPGLAPDVVGPRSLLPGETISLPLAPAKTVAGRVRDAKGEAVAGASVRLLEEPPGNWLGGARPALLGFEARTDAGGAFSLGGLPPGPFAVLVLAGGDGRPPDRERLGGGRAAGPSPAGPGGGPGHDPDGARRPAARGGEGDPLSPDGGALPRAPGGDDRRERALASLGAPSRRLPGGGPGRGASPGPAARGRAATRRGAAGRGSDAPAARRARGKGGHEGHRRDRRRPRVSPLPEVGGVVHGARSAGAARDHGREGVVPHRATPAGGARPDGRRGRRLRAGGPRRRRGGRRRADEARPGLPGEGRGAARPRARRRRGRGADRRRHGDGRAARRGPPGHARRRWRRLEGSAGADRRGRPLPDRGPPCGDLPPGRGPRRSSPGGVRSGRGLRRREEGRGARPASTRGGAPRRDGPGRGGPAGRRGPRGSRGGARRDALPSHHVGGGRLVLVRRSGSRDGSS
jgi:hypothetical protein